MRKEKHRQDSTKQNEAQLPSGRLPTNFSTLLSTKISSLRIGVFILIPSSVLHLLSATYNCPCAKAPLPTSIITLSNVLPWLLWIVIAQARRNGNWVKSPTSSCKISPLCSSNL